MITAVVLGVVSGLVRYGPTTDAGHRLIAWLATGVRVGDVGWLRVDGVAGDPWTDFTVARVRITDSRGVWLQVDHLSARWRPAALWARRVHITAVSAREITVIRRPVLLPSEPPSPSPVSVRIDKASALVILRPAFAWRRGDYRVEGAANIGRNNDVGGRVAAVSLSRPGDFARVGFKLGRTTIDLEAHAREAAGGALGGSLGLDPDKPFLLDARAHGSARSGWFTLTTTVGRASPAGAWGQWSPSGGEASGRLDLSASPWLAPWRKGVGDQASFTLTAARAAGPYYQVVLDGRATNVRLTAAGEIDPGGRRTGPAGMSIGLAVGDLSALAGAPGLGPASVTGRLTGDGDHWRLAGAAAVDRVQAAGLSLATVQGPFTLDSGPAGLVLEARALGAGGSGSGPVIMLLGRAPRAVAEVDWLPGGRMLLRGLKVHGATLDVEGEGQRGLFGALSFKGLAHAHDLGVAAPGTRGAVDAIWRAGQVSPSAPWIYSFDARGQGLRFASAEASSLLGPAPTLHGDGRYGGHGLIIDHAAFRGGGVALAGAGAVTTAGDLNLRFDWTGQGALILGPLALSGPSRGTGAVSGTLGRLRLDLMAQLKAFELPDLANLGLRDGRLALTVMADGPDVAGRVGVTATGDSGPAKAAAAFRVAAGEVALTDLDIRAGGANLEGAATLRGGEPTVADLTFGVGPGVLLRSGHVSGRVRVTSAGGEPRASFTLAGADLAFPGFDGRVSALTVSADGPLSRLPYRLEGRGAIPGLAGRLTGGGVLAGTPETRILSFAGAGRVGAAVFHTLGPAELAFRPSGVSGALRLGVGKGRADVTFARSGASLTARAVVATLDVALLDPDLRGRADGVLDVTSAGGSLSGSARAQVSDLSGRDMRGAAALAGSVNATFGGGEVALASRLADNHGSTMTAELRLPATLSASPLGLVLDSRRPISGRFAADGAVGPIWDLLEGGGEALTGRLVATGTIGGTLADPRFTGTAALAGGGFEDGAVGLSLRDLTLRADLKGDAIDVEHLSAGDGARGALAGGGRLSLVRGGVSGLRLDLKGFRLFDTTLGQATASGELDVARAADGKVRLGGVLAIDRARISPAAATPSGVVPMDVVEIHRPADFGAVLAPATDRQPPVALDIAIKAPGGIYIKGRGLNLEMSLDAHVSGTTAAPALTGVARVVRGDYDFAGKRFQIDDAGVVYLGPSPAAIRLDLTATRDDPTLTAVIKIAGTAATPTLTLSSTPALPQDEVLSQVLFGASAAQLSGFQAAQLASAVAGLAGGGGFDVIGGLRNFAHLDRLAIDSGAAAGFSVAGGKYVTDKVYVELSNSSKTGQGVQVEWRLKNHVAVVSRVTSQGDQALSIRWRKDY